MNDLPPIVGRERHWRITELLLVNATSFAMFHLFYLNWVAPPLAFIGGLLFAYRYRQTRSLFAVAFEHGLWGAFLFTIGLGHFFFSGRIR